MVEIIYILGSTRSGTSALRNALVETKFKGYGEGHLAPILADVISRVRYHRYQGLGSLVPGNGLNNLKENVLLRQFFHGYERYLASQIGSEYLLDKTPTALPIKIAPDLQAFHQNPKFIHCSRRHIDNIQSKIKKFPDQTFKQHCEEWVLCNQSWLNVRDHLKMNYIEFDFYQLVTNHIEIVEKIGAYLSLSADEIEAVSNYLENQRPESTRGRDLTKFLRMSELNWSDDEKEIFERVCGPLGRELGYDTEDYFS